MLVKSIRRLFRLWHAVRDPVGYARSLGAKVGHGCRFLNCRDATWGSEPYLVRVGDHVTITSGVRLVTHDGGVWVFRDKHPDIDLFGPITLGDNVFVGLNAIIMPGVTIGDNCVIGAGAVVTRDIPSGSVAAGVPARVIRTVEEYWERVEGRALHIKSLPTAQKRAILEDHFREWLAASSQATPGDSEQASS